MFNDKDLWYNRIIINIDRTLKVLTAQSGYINRVEQKLNDLTRNKRKPERISYV